MSAVALARSVVIGTAGHIDHGKTALVRALTGTDTDRLPEEKRRGITIDLGFASLDTQGPDGSGLRLSFIDVPGHRLFIRNMLAGAGGIDCAMLVVSAEEGVKPQTEEHLAICTMLGIRQGLTVISKADAVSASRLEEVTRAVKEFLRGSFLGGQDIPVLPVSAYTREGLPALQRSLVELAAKLRSRDAGALPRLAVDRAFVMKGFGTVLTGTLQSGTLANGDTLALEPGQRTVRVRGLQTHSQPVQKAEAGARVALNVAGVDVAAVHRGDTLVPPGMLAAVDTVDVEITLLPHSTALKHRARLHFHAFTAEALATLSLFEYEPIEAGMTRIARLRLSRPMVLTPGDRFVLRQLSPAATIGGGRILDAHPLPRLPKKKAIGWLKAIRDASPEQSLVLRVARHQTAGRTPASLALETGDTTERVLRALEKPLAAGAVVRASDDLLLTAEASGQAMSALWAQFQGKAQGDSGSGHRISELKQKTGLPEATFAYALARLAREQKVEVRGEQAFLFGHRTELPDGDRRRLAAITAVYAAAGLAVPALSEVAGKLKISDAEMRRLVTLLLRDKRLVRLGQEDLYLHQESLAKLKEQMRALRGQPIDVSRFKELTGLSRKYAIPLLEYLDREHVTRRQGDGRVVL